MINSHKTINKLALNFFPMLISLVVMQLIILPKLYSGDSSIYLNFNQLLYVPLLVVHVLNTSIFNQVIYVFNRDINNKYNLYPYVLFFAIYILCVLLLFVAHFVDFYGFIFILSLYPIDALLNVLRIQELDKKISLLLLLQIFIFSFFFCVMNVDVYLSYSFSNFISTIFGLHSVISNRKNIEVKKTSLISVVVGNSLLRMAIPTINRYIDKFYYLILLTPYLSIKIFPYVSLSGLMLMPLSATSKVIIRSVNIKNTNGLRKITFISSFVVTLFIYISLQFTVPYFYANINPIAGYVLIMIAASKAFNFLEIILFSTYFKKVNNIKGKISLYELSTISFLFIFLLLYVYDGGGFDFLIILLLPVYYFLSLLFVLFKASNS